MKFINKIIGSKRQAVADGDKNSTGPDALDESYLETISSIVEEKRAEQEAAKAAAEPEAAPDVTPEADEPARPSRSNVKTRIAATNEPVNIWDMDDDDDDSDIDMIAASPAPTPPRAPVPEPQAPVARSPGRSRRATKTRLIGFEKADGDVVDLFDSAPKAAPSQRAKFPVGWLVVVEGPGRGEAFSLLSGMSQIGRGDDQAVQLDFGDSSISRTNHAAVVFDPETKTFLLGHGGKTNIVRLNNQPVISNESLKSGDTIKIGETVLRFVAFCGKSFNWEAGETGEDEDVAIA